MEAGYLRGPGTKHFIDFFLSEISTNGSPLSMAIRKHQSFHYTVYWVLGNYGTDNLVLYDIQSIKTHTIAASKYNNIDKTLIINRLK